MTDADIAKQTITVLGRDGHVGRHHAIPRATLLWKLQPFGINVNDRTFRRIYNGDACPVLVCDGGLFLPACWYEVEDCLRYLAAHLSGPNLKHRADVLTLAYHELMTRDVGPLFNGERQEVRA